MNTDFVFAFKRICTALHMHTNIHIPVLCYSQRECDYAVHFVCRHPLDRCICWANLDGFSVWILNQNHIFPPFLAARALHVCHASCLPQQSFIDKAAMEENIAVDSYLHCMLSLCDEWEQHILVYVYTSYQMSLQYVVLFTVVIFLTFHLTDCLAFTFSVSFWFSCVCLVFSF